MNNNQKIRQELHQLAQSTIPENVDLWPQIKEKLAMSNRQMPTQKNYRLGWSLSFVLALSALLLIWGATTTQGQAWANSILNFFTEAQSTQLPLPVTEEHTAVLLEEVAEAELEERLAQLAWSVRSLPTTPAGLVYDHTEIGQEAAVVKQVYVAEGGGGQLVLAQGTGDFPADSAWDAVPVDVITAVFVNNHPAELVRGDFVALNPEANEATWNENVPIIRLRWQQDGVWYELLKHGDPHPIEYLGQEELIALAESLR